MTTSVVAPVRLIGRIPVRNLWLLMLYASELYRELPRSDLAGAEDNPDDLPKLLAELLTRAVERRMRRNLSLDYRRRQADLTRVRGRIDLLRTERRQLLRRGRVACAFDELTVDTPRNRYVKAALDHLRRLVAADPKLARRCRIAVSIMERAGVAGSLATQDRRRPPPPQTRLGRLGAEDRQMLAAARLAFDLSLPAEDPDDSHLPIPDRSDERWARRLFERAVAGFYDVVLFPQGWQVRYGRKIDWQKDAQTSGIAEILPSMQTDIELERPANADPAAPRRIVIDTKFTEILTPGYHRDQTLRSGYIYQIYAYLRTQERDSCPDSLNSTGVLLHPSVGYDLDESALIQRHQIRFATVNLAADTQTIRRQLLRIAAP